MTDIAVRTNGIAAFWEQSVTETGRLVRRWTRDEDVLISTVILPVLLLLMYQLVLNRVLTRSTGSAAVYGFVPMIAMTTAMYGAMGTGLSLHAERIGGLLRRLWVLPIHRASGVVGRLLAECLRTAAGTVLVFLVGMALGLRLHEGPLAALTALAVPVLFCIGFTPMVLTVALTRAGNNVVQIFAAVVLLGMFFNSGFAPVADYPGWLQPVVRYQPMSCAIEAMRGLTAGGPVAGPLLRTVVWSAGLAAVFGWAAVRGLRRAAQH